MFTNIIRVCSVCPWYCEDCLWTTFPNLFQYFIYPPKSNNSTKSGSNKCYNLHNLLCTPKVFVTGNRPNNTFNIRHHRSHLKALFKTNLFHLVCLWRNSSRYTKRQWRRGKMIAEFGDNDDLSIAPKDVCVMGPHVWLPALYIRHLTFALSSRHASKDISSN